MPSAGVLPAKQRVETVIATGQHAQCGEHGTVGNGNRPPLALLGDVIEHCAVALHHDVPFLQRRGTVMVVKLGVTLTTKPEQAKVDQPYRAGGYPVPVEPTPDQVMAGSDAKSGQRASEPQHVLELLRVALFPPPPVVAVLGASPAVHARGLDVAKRIR